MILKSLPVEFKSDEFKYHEFQEEAIKFIGSNKRSLVMLGVGAGKTLISLSLQAYLRNVKNKNYKMVYLTEKVSIRQIDKDLQKFFNNMSCMTLFEIPLNKRVSMYEDFLNNDSYDVLAISYEILMGAFGKKTTSKDKEMVVLENNLLTQIFNLPDVCFVVDEATALANKNSLPHKIVTNISRITSRTIALTATPIWKNLTSVYNIMKAVNLPIMSETEFHRNYCIFKTELMTGKTKDGRDFVYKKKVKGVMKNMTRTVFVGHKNVDEFWNKIKQFTFIKTINIDLPIRVNKYDITLNTDTRKSMRRLKSIKGFDVMPYNVTSIVLNSPSYIHNVLYEGIMDDNEFKNFKSPKYKWFIDLIDQLDEKILVYAPYTTIINDYTKDMEDYTYAKITGDTENSAEEEKDKFINNPKCKIMFITDAGSKGIDGLQIAKHLIFLNLPLGGSRYMQIIGRLRRLGSKHNNVMVHIPIIYDSIDEDLYSIIQAELRLISQVCAEQLLDKSLIDTSFDDTGIVKSNDIGEMEEWLKYKILNRKY